MKGFVILAEGFEEIEAVCVMDVLRRAQIDFDSVSITPNLMVTGTHNISIIADQLFEDANFEQGGFIVLPGGMPGTINLKEHKELSNVLMQYKQEEKYIAAICAAPAILGGLDILDKKNATCYPGFEQELRGAKFIMDNVVVDGKIITSKGPGTAIEFALKLVEVFKGSKFADGIRESMLI